MADEVTIDIRVLGSAEAVAATQQVQQAQQQLATVTTTTAHQATAATQQASVAQLSHWQNFTQGLQTGWSTAAQQATQGSAAVGAATTQGLTAALGPNSAAAAAAATQGSTAAGGFWSGFGNAFMAAAGGGGGAGAGVAGAAGASGAAGAISSGMASMLRRGLAGLGIGLAVSEVFGFLKDSVGEYAAAEQSAISLEDAYSRFPKLMKSNVDALMDFNMARQQSTRFDADETNAAAARLAQLGLTDEQLRGLIPLTQDYAAKTGKSVEQAAGSISSAFLGNGRALRDIAVQFKATGAVGYDYTKMMQLLNEQVGGFAEKDGAAAEGRLGRLSNRWGDIKENIGKFVLPVFEQVSDWFLNLVEWAGPPLEKVGGFFAALWPLIRPIAQFVGGTLNVAFTVLGKTIEGILWVFTKVAEGIKWLWDHSIGWIIDRILAAADSLDKFTSTTSVGSGTTSKDVTEVVNNSGFFAKGGVLPGYAPGVDSINARLSPGEGVLVPEVTRAIGADTIHSWNNWGVQQRFAFGGIAGQSPSYTKSPLEQALMKASWQSVFLPGGGAAPNPSASVSGAVPASPGVVPSGDPVGRWRALATQALQMTGHYSPENLDAMMKRIGWESTGDPNAINNWDSNAKKGTPSQGLLQVIPPTFAAYAEPGYDKDILDPLSNMLASINYATDRYGDLQSAYLRKKADGSVAGYDSGGWLPPGGIAVSGLDKPEAVLTPDQWDTMRSAADRPSGSSTITIQPGAFVISGVRDTAEVVAVLEREFPRIIKSYRRDRNTKEL